MSKITNDAKGIIAVMSSVGSDNELDHFYNCEQCGQSVDMRDLGQVCHHEKLGHASIDLES